MGVRPRVTGGMIAGFIAAAVFAAWFFAVDAVRSEPFSTPAYISRFILGAASWPTAERIAVFTLLHFVAFALAGITAALLLDRAEIQPTIGLGAIYGFVLFDVAFYFSLILLGSNVVRALGWPLVLTGNVLAGIVMFGYLRARAGLPISDVRGVLRRSNTLRYGLIDGLIGGVIVAVWFLIVDALRHRIFYTPAALGSALLSGASSPGDVVVQPSVVLAYTVVHFATFIALGLLIARLAEEAEAHPPLLLGIILLFVTLEVLSIGILAAAAAWLFLVLPWWSPIAGNLLAATGMFAYLWRVHPELHARLGQPLEEPEFQPPPDRHELRSS